MRCANTRTTGNKWGFLWELPPLRQGIHIRKEGIPPGITSLFTQIQACIKIKMRGKSFEW
jgi:hypothetical protein